MINIDKSFRWVSKNYFDTTFARLFLIITLGIIVAEYTALATNIFLVAIVVGFIFMIFSTFRVNQLGRWIFVFSWSLFLFGAGGWLLRQRQMPELPSDTHSYIVELKTTPISKGSYYRAEAEIVYASDSIGENLIGYNVLLNLYTDSLLDTPQLCDRYLINAKILRPDNGGLDGFDYGKYLARNGLCGATYLYGNNIKYLSTVQPRGVVQRSYLLRDKLIRQLESIGLEGSQLAIISAITLGEKDLLSNDVRDTFSAAGVSHILVVSGMHVSLHGQSDQLEEGVDDGVLTAREISAMDLSNCELVVLSACETGQGEYSQDGTIGLQRAFKQAGVQTIVMSLWPVNDSATQMLMTEFYNNWIVKKQSKREAFKNAQNAVRAKYEEPEYWAGFVMLD